MRHVSAAINYIYPRIMMIFKDESICKVCLQRADYLVWGPFPMDLFCLEHLIENRPTGMCYVYIRDRNPDFLINGRFKRDTI